MVCLRGLFLVIAILFLTAFGLAGCGGDPCADLSDMCATCPADNEGQLARASCDHAVESGDELACEDRLESGIYEAFGCSEP